MDAACVPEYGRVSRILVFQLARWKAAVIIGHYTSLNVDGCADRVLDLTNLR